MDKKLKLLKEYWLKNSIPNITETNAKFIRDLIKISKSKNMLEIWTANWYSTIHFALELKKSWGHIITIDFSEKSYNEAKNNFKDFNLENIITPILWNALDEIPNLKDKFDFIFIDWMMRRTKDFLDLVWKKTNKWWIIIIDDVIKFKNKMIWLDDYLKKNKIQYNILPIDIDDWIMMIIK